MVNSEDPSLSRAALIAGLSVLVMALTVPIVEFYIFPQLINHRDAEQTVSNIRNHTGLFSIAIFIHFTTVVCDIIAGWALYLFFKPVNKNFALVTAWFRIVNSAFTIAAIANLVQVLAVLHASNFVAATSSEQLNSLVLYHVHSFNYQWRFMLIFFGIYMNLLGFLALRASYVPKIMGVLLIISGVGYIIDDLKYFFYPQADTGFLWLTYFGEVIFMFWLLFKGLRKSSFDSSLSGKTS